MLLYPLAFYYCELLKNPNYELDIHYMHKINLVASVYNIDFDEESKDSSYLISKFLALIDIILNDIIIARELDESFYDYIISILDDRKLLYYTMKVIKFE